MHVVEAVQTNVNVQFYSPIGSESSPLSVISLLFLHSSSEILVFPVGTSLGSLSVPDGNAVLIAAPVKVESDESDVTLT